MKIQVCLECRLVFEEGEEIPHGECPGCKVIPDVFVSSEVNKHPGRILLELIYVAEQAQKRAAYLGSSNVPDGVDRANVREIASWLSAAIRTARASLSTRSALGLK